jgi:hypothetical protein
MSKDGCRDEIDDIINSPDQNSADPRREKNGTEGWPVDTLFRSVMREKMLIVANFVRFFIFL